MTSQPTAPSRNLRVLVEYDGQPYVGWQAQTGQASIESTLQQAVQKMTGVVPKFRVAGRTDAGVHAMGQVCNFHTASAIEIQHFAQGLNHYLPDSISVHSVEEVDAAFDARVDSIAKSYRYRVYRAEQPAALERRAWHLRGEIDVQAMQEASKYLLGERDFNAFRSKKCDAAHAKREMHSISIERTPRLPVGQHIEIVFRANAYCRHMCRILAGTLFEVGLGKRPGSSIGETLKSRDRREAGITAPPEGLTLLEVEYSQRPQPPGG